jgi:hypothetical protein
VRPAGGTRIFIELEVRRVDCRRRNKVKGERLEFLADNPLYIKRFAYYVLRRCRDSTIKDVAAELMLDWHTVKALEMQYMQAQLKRAGIVKPSMETVTFFRDPVGRPRLTFSKERPAYFPRIYRGWSSMSVSSIGWGRC